MTVLDEPMASRRYPKGHATSGTMARRAIALAVALAAMTTAGSAAAQPIGIMTYNQYFGADISRLIQAPPEAFNETLVDVLGTIAANRFPARAALQARSIALNRPDLVALQEVWRLACVDLAPAPVPPGRGCTDPAIAGAFNDQLEVTLAALAAFPVSYSVAAQVTNFRIDGTEGVPFVINGFPALLQFADRDVILVNDETTSQVAPVDFPSPPCRPSDDGCNYNIALEISVTVPVPGEDPINLETLLERGFVAVDATVRGEDHRFVSTHLEVKDPPVPAEFQCAQAAELFGILAITPMEGDRSLLIAGDFNSGPDDVPLPGVVEPTPPGLPPVIAANCFGDAVVPPYLLLTQAGLNDVWTFRTGAAARLPPRVDGYTCCQTETLRNNRSRLNDRIDLIFSLAPPTYVLSARVVGDTVVEKTFPFGRGLWPSDHGGVVATFQLGASVADARTVGPRRVAAR